MGRKLSRIQQSPSLTPLSVESVRGILKNCTIGSKLEVLYESSTSQSKGLEPHPKVYRGRLEGTRETKSGDFLFVLREVEERQGEYRSFNPSKGLVVSIRKEDE